MMIWQLHHQSKKDRSKTEFCSQRKFETRAEYDKWLGETQKKFPLPKGFEWLCCSESSEFFVKQVSETKTQKK